MTRKLINVEGENKKANKRSKSASGIPDTTSENVAVQENEKDQGHDQNQGEGEGSLPLTQQQSSIASSQNISNTAVPLTIDNVTSHWTWEMIQKSADYLKYRVGCIGYDNDVSDTNPCNDGIILNFQ